MTSDYFKAWYDKNRERINAKNRAKAAADRGKRLAYEHNRSDEAKAKQKEYLKRYYQEHSEEIKARSRAWELANPEQKRKKTLEWQRANPEKRIKTTRAYREANHEKVRAANIAWYKANPKRYVAYGNARRAALMQRTPLWADLDKIAEFYEACPEGYHVDHYYPLQGKLVSGLHTLANLQYLPALENFRKNNKMPDELRPC